MYKYVVCKQATLQTMSKLVYKYRFGDDDTFERDLKSIERNTFFAPCSENLNDPCENLVLKDNYKRQIGLIKKVFGQKYNDNYNQLDSAFENFIERKNHVGIYSLSQTYNDELLWAHYANSHKGFCIEYDFNLLLNNYSNEKLYNFAVKYSNFPPQLSLTNALSKDLFYIVKKISGTKSKRWKYEQEYRIVINKCGIQMYDHKALRGIYFGLRMEEKRKNEIMRRLGGRGINFYQIRQKNGSYGFEAIMIDSDTGETYLKRIPKIETGKVDVNFNIRDKKYEWVSKKGTIEIILDKEVNDNSLAWLANLIREQVFSCAERIYMFYWIKGDENKGICWATTHYQNQQIKVLTN